MLPIDPGDGPGSVPPAPPLPDIVPAEAMTRGGTIIRPGAVAWGGLRDARDGESSSCEAIERTLASVGAHPGRLPGLLAELTRTRLWVPLPVRNRPFTDGTAVRLPVVSHAGTDFVPCFTSVQRLTTWAGAPQARAGDPRLVPHIVVPAAGLARRLPPGLGLALNPESAPGLPLYPECVSYLARLAAPGPAAWDGTPAGQDEDTMDGATRDGATTDGALQVRHPPAEPVVLLREITSRLRSLPAVRHASRAWLAVRGRGEGLVISVALDDPASGRARRDVIGALRRAVAAVPLRAPFPVDVIFPGESEPHAIDEWMARNTRPFFTRS